MKNNRQQSLYMVLSGVFLFVIILVLGLYFKNDQELPITPVTPAPIPSTETSNWQGFIYEEETLSIETLEEQLKATGFLVSYEYCFTDLIDYSKVKKWGLIHSTTYFTISYDGTVSAGIDFQNVKVTKDGKKLIISLPKAVIKGIDIDPKSMVVHSEKQGFSNPITVEQFNSKLVELEKNAEQKALKHGIIRLAEENAKSLVGNMVRAILQAQGYYYSVVVEIA